MWLEVAHSGCTIGRRVEVPVSATKIKIPGFLKIDDTVGFTETKTK